MKKLLLIPFVMMVADLHSQDGSSGHDDFEVWENINANKHLSRRVIARFSHEGRFTEDASHMTYYYGDVGLEYKLPFWHLGLMGDYVFIRKLTYPNNTAEFWSTRHQYYTALTWSHKFGKWSLHDRQMIMGQVKDVLSSDGGRIPDYYFRNKLTAEYKFNYYWRVYASEELYYHVVEPKPASLPHINRVRYFIGAYYKVNDHHEFELYALMEQHVHIIDPAHNYVLGVGYEYSFD